MAAHIKDPGVVPSNLGIHVRCLIISHVLAYLISNISANTNSKQIISNNGCSILSRSV